VEGAVASLPFRSLRNHHQHPLQRPLIQNVGRGDARIRQFGKVDIPQEALIQALKMGD